MRLPSNLCLWFLFFFGTVLATAQGSMEPGVSNHEENETRTKALINSICSYMANDGNMVALLARRGKITNAAYGVSDVDRYDATGMAHSGFIIRGGFSGANQYLTLNLVKKESVDDQSQLRAWSLEHFFMGSGEKDALLMVPVKKVQYQLWNALVNGMKLVPTKIDVDGQEYFSQVVEGGGFSKHHNPAYNLLSDYAYNQTQNCNEHLVKTLLAIIRGLATTDEVCLDLELNYVPFDFKMTKFKKWFANNLMGMHLKSGERIENGKRKFRIITVESMVAAVNRPYLGIEKIQVFREAKIGSTYQILDLKDDYIKRNTKSGKPNKSHF